MAQKKDSTQLAHPEVDEAAFGGAMSDMRQMQVQTLEQARELSTQIGYTGPLTIGAVEEEVRYWQQRTVESCLELGKRLLILRELTPHGDFIPRLELLGFAKRTAYRFMNAASKTAKSANLAHLAKQVKQQSLFLELVTEDDDVIERMAQIDDIERMSPSEARRMLREAREEMKAKDELVGKKSERIHQLEEQAVRIKRMPKKESTEELLKQFGGVVAGVGGAIDGELGAALQALDADDAEAHRLVMAAAVATMRAKLSALADQYGLPEIDPDAGLDWLRPEGGAADAAGAEG